MTSNFNLHNALQSNQYVLQQYTVQEVAEKNMLNRELENAQKVLDAQTGFLGLTLGEKIKDLMIPGRVIDELRDVAINTLTQPAQQFFAWLDENELGYNVEKWEDEIRGNVKQLNQTRKALYNAVAKNGLPGSNFTYNM